MRIGSNSFLGAFFLIILLLSLFLSIFGSVGVFYGESYHVVVILEANPQRYVDNVLHIFLYLILPIATSLTFFIITCIKRRETPTEGLSNWLLIIFGGFCMLWGYRYFEASYVSYFDTIMMAHDWHISNIDGSLLAIYTAYGLVGILWLITGLFFIITSAIGFYKSLRVLYRQSKKPELKYYTRERNQTNLTCHYKTNFWAFLACVCLI